MTHIAKNFVTAGPGHGIQLPHPFRGETIFFEDFVFMDQTSFSTVGTTGGWLVGGAGASVAAGTILVTDDVLATSNIVPGPGGILRLVTAAGGNDEIYISPNGTAFKWEQGTALTCSARFTIGDDQAVPSLASSEGFFGMLVKNVVDPYDNATTLTADIGFGFTMTAGAIAYYSRYDTTLPTTTTTNRPAATTAPTMVAPSSASPRYVRFDIYWDGVSKLTFSVNGVIVATQTIVGTLTPAFLSPIIGVGNSTAATKMMLIDYVYAAQECVAAGR